MTDTQQSFFDRNRTVILWVAGYVLPFLTALVIQVPLCVVKPLSNFFEHLPQIHALWLLSVIYLGPGYVLLLADRVTKRRRALRGLILALTTIPHLYLVWIFGFWTSHLLFSGCMT